MAKVPAYIELDPIREDHITKNIIKTDGKHSIPFRDWREKGKQSDVFEIDLDYVRYRPENGDSKLRY